MFFKGVWFLIAGVLLLGHIPALAEPYPMECKDRVVFYHFVSQEPNPPRRAGKNTPQIRGEAWVQVSPPHPKPSLVSAKGPSQVKSKVKPAAVPPSNAPVLVPSMPGTAQNVQIPQPKNARSMILAGTDYLMGLLTKLGCRYPLVSPAYAGYPRSRPQDVAAAQAPRIAVPEGWQNLLKYAQEQPAFFMESGSLSYSFPVAGPFSFRDSWGDSRSRGRMHRAVDIFAPEGAPVYALTTGVIDGLASLPEAGITLFLKGHDGRGYGYMHLQGYAPGLVEGKLVRTGELIGYVGRTGMQTSAAHLHLQVYADHRLCRDELLNPYSFLVQLCHGIGVTDLYQHQIARLEAPSPRVNGIQVYRSSNHAALKRRVGVRNSSVLVIRNY